MCVCVCVYCKTVMIKLKTIRLGFARRALIN